MKVSELIQELLKQHPDMEVYISIDQDIVLEPTTEARVIPVSENEEIIVIS